MATKGRPATGRIRRYHLSVWVLPAVAELLRRHCEEAKQSQVDILEDAIQKRCS